MCLLERSRWQRAQDTVGFSTFCPLPVVLAAQAWATRDVELSKTRPLPAVEMSSHCEDGETRGRGHR